MPPDPPPPILPDSTGPCVLSVENAQDGLLLVRFNEAMLQDNNIIQAANYVISPLFAAVPVTILDVKVNTTQTNAATILFEGGPGDYELVVNNVSEPVEYLSDRGSVTKYVMVEFRGQRLVQTVPPTGDSGSGLGLMGIDIMGIGQSEDT